MGMSEISLACDSCNNDVKSVFDPTTGSRQSEIIAGDLLVSDRCFVRDEIRFINNGRLIFIPRDNEKNNYYNKYFVICRRLVIVGGHKPGTLNPCGPDDPGLQYAANNVITWQDRLKAAADGGNYPAGAADGESHKPHVYEDKGQGNNGLDGGNGTDGAKGKNGKDGLHAPSVVLIALEIEVGVGDHLTIDFDGQTGGDGGKGQTGGKGGNGMRGKIGASDTSWPGTGCDRQPGDGGDGGNGGNGGPGGDGGKGGNAGSITVISLKDNISGSGDFVSGKITYVNDGATGGKGGKTGLGAKGGLPGKAGFPTSECSEASEGNPGLDGQPEPLSGADPSPGATGGHGASGGNPKFEEIKPGTCADLLPIDMKFDATGLQPSTYCRGFSTQASHTGTITGQNLAQVTTVTTDLTNVTLTKKLTSTDTQLDLKIDIDGNSGLGTGKLDFHRAFGTTQTLNNALAINKFQVLSISPAQGQKGTVVNVTITGQCFSSSVSVQQVTVSGGGVSVSSVLVVDASTIQCVFDIGSGVLVPANARDVTVTMGDLGQIFTHTLVNGFTVQP
jgi:hypothetical protein